MKKLTLLFILFSIVIVSGCTTPASGPETNDTDYDVEYGSIPTEYEMKLHTSDKFSIEYADFMSIDEVDGSQIFFLTPREDELDFRENVNIIVREYGKDTNLNLESYARSLSNLIDEEYYGPEITQSFDTTINNVTVRRMEFNGRQKGTFINMKFLVYVWIDGMTAYEFTYSAQNDGYDKVINVAEKMAESFTIF